MQAWQDWLHVSSLLSLLKAKEAIMSKYWRYWVPVVLWVLAMVCSACGDSQATQFSSQRSTPARKGATPMILVFSKTTGYRHASIEPGIVALGKLAQQHHVRADFT